MIFDKRHKRKFQGIWIFISIIMILGMIMLYMPTFQ
jgi:hypothetical protein